MGQPRSIGFVVPGTLVGKGRHRSFVDKSGKIGSYTPKKTRSDEGVVKFFASQAMRDEPLLRGPLEITIRIVRVPPKSWSKARQERERFVTGKPDASNVLKLVEDGCNRCLFYDDSQIAVINLVRFYERNVAPRIEVYVSELEETHDS